MGVAHPLRAAIDRRYCDAVFIRFGPSTMSNLLQDFRYALRGLRAHASFSVTAVLTLALGIGVTTAMFGVVNGIVLRPLPFANADRLITICTQNASSSPDRCAISPPNVA